MIGTPKEEADCEFIKSEEARLYLKCFKPCEPTDLSEMYPSCESRGLSLLKSMLQFNPAKRISA